MKQYDIINHKFKFDKPGSLGTKIKYWEEINGKSALVKMNRYQKFPESEEFDVNKEWNSNNVSEKIFSEIAKILEFSCVQIDFVKDSKDFNWLASYNYNKTNALSGKELYIKYYPEIINKNYKNNKKNIVDEDYKYEDVFKLLYHYSGENFRLIRDFNKVIIMDTLTGESDRHYENWGLYFENEKFNLLPMYDNSACLLHNLRNEATFNNVKKKDLEVYSANSYSKMQINNKKTKHFDFLELLLTSLDGEERMYFKSQIMKINILTDDTIRNIVFRVPNSLCSIEHKIMIVEYIIIRREKMLKILEEK